MQYKCSYCNGHSNGCYHCCETGIVSEETMEIDRDAESIGKIALAMTDCEQNQEERFQDEDWAFAAAENRSSIQEYRQYRFLKNLERLQEELKGVSSLTLSALKELLTVKPQPIMAPKQIEVEQELEEVPF